MVVKNCISSGCVADDFWYNQRGQITRYEPAVVNAYVVYTYRADGLLDVVYNLEHCCEGDTIFSSRRHVYSKRGKLIRLERSHYEKNVRISTEKLSLEEWQAKQRKSVYRYNAQGQITAEELGNVYFPCGHVYKGKHRATYYYSENGLLARATIHNEAGDLIADLVYEYTFYD